MQFRAVPVASEAAHEAETAFSLNVTLHCLREVDERPTRLKCGNTSSQRLDSALHQCFADGITLFDRVGPCCIPDPTFVAHTDIYREKISAPQR